MRKEFLEAGKIVNTHGVRGEVKIQPWANSPSFLLDFQHLYIDGAPVSIRASRVHGSHVIASLGGVDGLDDAIRLKNKIIYIARSDATLPEGEHFVQDLIGLAAVDAASGRELGRVEQVLSLPAQNVYVIRGEREILVPAVPEFIEVDMDGGRVRVTLLEGM